MSTVTHVCPVTKKRKVEPLDDGPAAGAAVFIPFGEEDTDIDLPVGWGRITIEIVAKDAAAVQHAAAKAAMLEEGHAKISADATATDEQKAQSRAMFDSEVERAMPDQAIDGVIRIQFPCLSDDAIGKALLLLKDAGFPIEVQP